ncbi:hypothetical protein BZG36_00798 [Bifiguratus adelaidae]|uniref:glucan endo-1,3-beta-D-glucosidase n=1 Tax=Bifiguratus adelaidae TaxID=1938954 RepID=A0A261Y6N8_9FUNG|nr:hypothetical protein BZG36_00798 [Bifiguratus adelaidae]
MLWMIALALLLAACASATLPNHNTALYGFAYGIDPTHCPSLQEVEGNLAKVKPFVNVSQGLQLMLGLWVNNNPSVFAAQKQALVHLVSTSNVDNVIGVSVGSESLYRGEVDSNTLAGYITETKQALASAGKSIPVSTADVYYKFEAPVIQAVDYLMMNAFPYWEGVAISSAADTLFNHINYVKSIAQGKEVVVSETGWPSAGPNFQSAQSGVAQQAQYLSQVSCRAQQTGTKIFWFEANDEPWKGANTVESHWGLWDVNGQWRTNYHFGC